MLLLKQSTAVTVKIGPFIDDTDGKTAETALTISQADVRLSKNGGDMAQKTESTACTHDELGIYDCPLDATDTATLGRLRLHVHESGALPVCHEFMVVPANVYDSLVGGTDTLEADAVQAGGSALQAASGYLKVKDAAGNDVAPDADADAILAQLEALVGTPVITSTIISGTEQDIAHYRGDTAPIAFDLGRDITSASLAFTVKRRHSDAQAAALITKTSAQSSELEITDAEAGQFVVKLLADDTADLLPDGRRATFVYDVEMTLDGVVETVAAGDLALVPDVTTG